MHKLYFKIPFCNFHDYIVTILKNKLLKHRGLDRYWPNHEHHGESRQPTTNQPTGLVMHVPVSL